MKPKFHFICILFGTLLLTSCGSLPATDISAPNNQQSLPTPAEPSGTISKQDGANLVLSHPKFDWLVRLPEDWIVTYDAGYRVHANSPDQAVFLHIQAQRWEQSADRLPDAKAYVEHWKNSTYGDIFPLYANGTQVSETEIGHDKFGGPYLCYEFDDSNGKVHYLQVYASAGGPSSAIVTTWTAYDEYDATQSTMQAIIDSFELVEESQ